MVATELRSQTTVRLWQDELRSRRLPPFSTGPDSLFIAYTASAEIGCFLELGWPVPERILDLFVEFRAKTGGHAPAGHSLLGALTAHGLDSMAATEKEGMRQLAIRGGPWTDQERRDLLDYCQTDVDALARLLPLMLPRIDLPRALLRGRYMAAVARIERQGLPVDRQLLERVEANQAQLRQQLIDAVDPAYGIYEGASFNHSKFARYLVANRIPWPKLASGRLDTQDETFKDMAELYPQLNDLRQLRKTLSILGKSKLPVGHDSRNRSMLGVFGQKSGRNNPRSSEFILTRPAWFRSLVQAPAGRAIAYVDWSQQEFGIAGALSGDQAMMDAYLSDDPYLSFAKLAGAAPPDATKASHPEVREQFKTCSLGVLFSMGQTTLAQRTGQPKIAARGLLNTHREIFSKFWSWNDAAATRFAVRGQIQSVFGWPLRHGPKTTERSARNFPMQAAGADMMRLAACLLTEAGIEVCAPVHDAFLVEADLADIEDVVAEAQRLMRQASAVVLSGFELESDAVIYRHPARYADKRGSEMFETVCKLLDTCPPAGTTVSPADATCPPVGDSSSYQLSIHRSFNN